MSTNYADYFDAIRARLAGLPTELIGDFRPAKKVLGIPRAARIVPVGEAWHLGALLVTSDAVLATGDITRSREPSRRGYSAQSARERDELRFTAYRGGVPDGRAVHYNWTPLDLDELSSTGSAGPLSVRDGELMIRWSKAGSFAPVQAYLDERIALLAEQG